LVQKVSAIDAHAGAGCGVRLDKFTADCKFVMTNCHLTGKMSGMERSIKKQIIKDLEKKMVFVSGPRQAGKTTLANSLTSVWPNVTTLNYDSDADRPVFLKETWDKNSDLVVFDEIHKYGNWKNKIKGVFDKYGIPPRMLITGSARLNILKRTGDSLAGRFFHHRLYPFSYKELTDQGCVSKTTLQDMLTLGTFPEPFLSGSETDARRWRKDYLTLVLTQDVTQLEDVRDLSSMQLLVDLLRERVGSPVSYKSLAGDLQISPTTVNRYITILERLYLVFRLTPFHKNIARSLLKEPKIYFFDVGLVTRDGGARFENLVALHLLKHAHFIEDTQGYQTQLCYLRDREKHEVDFFLIDDDSSQGHLIEAKTSDIKPDGSIRYFGARIPNKKRSLQVVLNSDRTLQYGDLKCVPASTLFSELAI